MWIKNKNELLNGSNIELKKYALNLLEYALDIANPVRVVEDAIKRDNKIIRLPNGKSIEIKENGRIFVIGFGKASQLMAQAIEKSLGDLIFDGIVITPYTTRSNITKRIRVIEAGHPLPDENSVKGCKEILRLLSNTKENDIVFVLISGGGSALFECPKETLTWKDLQVITEMLLKSGADIYEINTIRKHLSKVKGGQLVEYIRGNVISLIISDVVGDDLSVIASGPTVPDNTTYKDAYEILKRYDLWDRSPNSIRDIITLGIKGKLKETPKANNLHFAKVTNILLSSNKMVIERLAEKIRRDKKFNAFILTTRLVGEAQEMGKLLANLAINIIHDEIPVKPPSVILLGGETTVTVKGNGKGGRNQELVLSALNTIKDREKGIIFVSMGTDGIDGESNAAGAMADRDTYIRAMSKGIRIGEYLENNNSFEFFKKVGNSLLYTGYTGTNVNDIVIMIIK